MKTSTHRRVWLYTALAGFLIAVGWLTYLPLWTLTANIAADRQFKKNYSDRNDYFVEYFLGEWEISNFAGTTALPRLRRLAQDKSLAPIGRTEASNLVQRISTGAHIPELYWLLHRGDIGWLRKQYLGYVLTQDSAYLKRHGLPIPDDTGP